MDLAANDNYFGGRAKIDRIRIMFIPDANTGVANMRAGQVNTFLPTGGPDLDQLLPLKQEWSGSGGKGDVLLERVRWQFAEPQKGAIASPQDLKDTRVRQALIMMMNRQELTQNLQGEFGGVADSWVHPSAGYYNQVRDSITAWPFDVRRAQALMADAGWTLGGDGMLQKNGQHFNVVIRPEEARVKEAQVIQQDWRAAGIDAQLEILSNVLLRDAEARANIPGVGVNQNPMGGVSAVRRFASDQTPTAANRFAGTNRGQYNNPQWDDVGLRLRTALDDNTRLQLEKELLQIETTDLPALPIQYELQAIPAYGFKGMVPVTGAAHTGNIMHTTDVNQWEII
jgi:peptide/nickel transport system substrate-binding protein